MLKRKECIAMLLAGGQGSRLTVLTEKTAKPAVEFGGKYRIIDFPLSNCVNSGIDTVGILTQYQPLELNAYIGNGQSWGLNRNFGGVHILPPYAKSKSSEWYKGTANAVYQNINFIDIYDPEYVLILSGDHIYTMDYAKMLEQHKALGSDVTIAVFDVPIEEASRFGIMNCDSDKRIVEFEEKPKHPRSTLASMGIYIFNWSVLRDYLIADEKDPASSNDFGKNIIPKLLDDGKSLHAYSFEGYWKDVGTIGSLWEANMDTLGEKPVLDLRQGGKIYARNYAMPCTYVSTRAKIENSFIAEGCSVYGNVSDSVISGGVVIEEGVEIRNCFIMSNTVIKKGSVVKYAIIGEKCVIGDYSKIGEQPEVYRSDDWGIAVVGNERTLKNGTTLLPDKAL